MLGCDKKTLKYFFIKLEYQNFSKEIRQNCTLSHLKWAKAIREQVGIIYRLLTLIETKLKILASAVSQTAHFALEVAWCPYLFWTTIRDLRWWCEVLFSAVPGDKILILPPWVRVNCFISCLLCVKYYDILDAWGRDWEGPRGADWGKTNKRETNSFMRWSLSALFLRPREPRDDWVNDRCVDFCEKFFTWTEPKSVLRRKNSQTPGFPY